MSLEKMWHHTCFLITSKLSPRAEQTYNGVFKLQLQLHLQQLQFDIQPVVPVAELITSSPSDGWVVSSNLGVIWGFSHTTSNSGERLGRGYTKFDFTVDEGKRLLDPSRDKKEKASIAEGS